MSNVVELDPAGGPRPLRTAASMRKKPSRSALVLGGGGFTGAVYEIGALRALDLLSVNRTVNQFDVYVGTSAGSLVGSSVANGVTPEEMMRVIVQQGHTTFKDVRASALLRPNYMEYFTKGVRLPFKLARLAQSMVRDFGSVTAVDLVTGFAESLPFGPVLQPGDREVRQGRPVGPRPYRRLP